MTDSAWYVYAVARADNAANIPATLSGHHAAGIEPIVVRGLVAYASPVDPDLFSETRLAERLEDLDWLEAVARTHHHVVDTICTQCTALPLSLVTVFHTPANVQAMLVEHGNDMHQKLDHLDGCLEWGIKAYGLADTTAEACEPDTAALGPGAAYLARRRAAHAREQARSQDHQAQASRVDTELAHHARQVRAHAPQNPRLSGRDEPMLLNQAYLVPETERAAFFTSLARLRNGQPGLDLVLTGPWAPYSFVDTPKST